MPSTYLVRRATVGDAGRLAQCRRTLFRELGSSAADADAAFESTCEHTLAHYLDAGHCVGWIADVPGVDEPIGSLVMLTQPRLPSPRNPHTTEGYILNVYVVPSERHQGVASALTQAAIDHARREHFARLRLHASRFGRPVYLRAGFRGRDDEMELDLAASEDVAPMKGRTTADG